MSLSTADFDFALPEALIAQAPIRPRDAARLLVVRGPGAKEALEDRGVAELPALLQPGDVMVVNNTRVIPARLEGVRVRGDHVARIEATLIKRESSNRWRALVRPAKRLAPGDRSLRPV